MRIGGLAFHFVESTMGSSAFFSTIQAVEATFKHLASIHLTNLS